jgi:hypothetical protein
MATPATIFFAGVATVVAAMGVGFGGALVLTSTTPAHKEPPAAFAKRDEPLQEPKVVSKGAAPTTVAAAPAPALSTSPAALASTDVQPPAAKTAEEVAALTYAPPQVPEPRPQVDAKAVRSDPGPARVGSAEAERTPVTEPTLKKKVVAKTERKRKAPAYNPDQADTPAPAEARREIREPRYDRRRILVADQRRRTADDADDEDDHRVTFVEREREREPRGGGGLFESLFGFRD